VLAVLCGSVAAQSSSSQSAAASESSSADDLAKAVQNPLASLISLPFQANWNDGMGEYDRTLFNLNIQPVVPFNGKKWNIITRTIVPINTVPVGETLSVTGLGDISYNMFWSPANATKFIWGIGPSISIPTAANREVLGTGKFSAGPTGVIFYGVGKFTMGVVASNVWSFAGESHREDVNFFFAQWFVNYNLGGGLALGTAPIITCNWNYEPSGDDDDQCTIPLGLQISKVMVVGKRPINVLFGYYTNVQHPEGGAGDQFRFQVNFLFPRKD
jgi:hypothetical protein